MLIRLLCITAFSLNLLAADPFLGTWKLNLAESRFPSGNTPRSMTVVWSKDGDGDGDGVKVATTGVGADGSPIRSEYMAVYNGKETPNRGPWNWDIVINRQISEREREDVFKKAGKVEGTSKLRVSENGSKLTVEFEYRGVRSVRVYDRQQ